MPGWGDVACSLASLALAGHLLAILVLSWGLAPPSTAGPDFVPTGGRGGCRFLLKFSNGTVVWRLFQAPSRRWAECRREFPPWIRTRSCSLTPSGWRLLRALVSGPCPSRRG